MASTPLGDIPGARFGEGYLGTVGAVASGGANAVIGYFGPYAYPIRVRNAWYTPTAGNQAATQSASYRRITVVNGGPQGTATATTQIMASLNASASVASLTPAAFATADVTAAAGSLLYFSQGTVGGADANGTVLAAGQFALAYEIM